MKLKKKKRKLAKNYTFVETKYIFMKIGNPESCLRKF